MVARGICTVPESGLAQLYCSIRSRITSDLLIVAEDYKAPTAQARAGFLMDSVILIDTGVLVALYDQADRYHGQVIEFLGRYRGRLLTTLACVTEVMWLLASDYRVQNEFLQHLAEQIYECELLQSTDFIRIAELNAQYFDLPADFADLGLVAVSERLNIAKIATLDQDFDVYRR